MAYKIIWEQKGILVVHSGTVTDEEVMEVNGIMYGDPRFEKIIYQISDYSEVTSNLITPQDAKVIGTLDRSSSRWNHQKMKIIVVTTDEKFIPVVQAYFKEFSGTDWECRIFENLTEAHDWVK